ncbi:FHA domain-containing protein [Candidatus Uabimicrobium amorphum]|uniref:Peptide-binding protein n=1 Tax=Uabimicrobium amorphum TaxID=2596890 RepID=A0A5S9IRE3_UABAM|nr:FHA domain-containing protein [Candidatus Uabimicrobium amorphum]BBM86728.1 peptide-binding protein [Candidatus Uabimicrobium amorphum]
MAVLRLKITRGFSKVFEIDRKLTIGRRTGNDIVVLDKGISRNHACVFPEGSEIIIEDLNSSNGVQVNGVKISKRKVLENKDVIVIGHKQLVFSTEIIKKLDVKKLAETLKQDPYMDQIKNVYLILNSTTPREFSSFREMRNTIGKMQQMIKSLEKIVTSGQKIHGKSSQDIENALEFLKNPTVKQQRKTAAMTLSIRRSDEEVKYLKKLGSQIERTLHEYLIDEVIITKEVLWDIFSSCGMTEKETIAELIMTGSLSDNFFNLLKTSQEEAVKAGENPVTDVLSFFDTMDDEIMKEDTVQVAGAVVGEISEIEKNYIEDGDTRLQKTTKRHMRGEFDLLTQIASHLLTSTNVCQDSVHALMRLSAYHFDESYIKETLEVIGNAFCCPDHFAGYDELQDDLKKIDLDIENIKVKLPSKSDEDLFELSEKVKSRLLGLFVKYPHLEEYVPYTE